MSISISNYSQFYRGTEKIDQYGSVSAGGKDTLVRYEFNTTDADGNKVMNKMSREETIQTMNEISSQYGDNVIVEFSGDGLAMLAESRKGQLDGSVGKNRAEKQAQFNNDVVQMQGTYRKVEGKVEDGDDFYSILKANDPELAKQVEEMNMRIINHKPGDVCNAADFNKLMRKAMSVVNTAKERDAEAAKSKSLSVEDIKKEKEMLSKLVMSAEDGMETLFHNRLVEKNGMMDKGNLDKDKMMDNCLAVYRSMYDEIRQGYAQGTREKWIADGDALLDTPYRKLTEEEEIAALDKTFNFYRNVINGYMDHGIKAGQDVQKAMERTRRNQIIG